MRRSDRDVSKPVDLGKELKHVTALFADIVNSTHIVGALDPEEADRLLDSILGPLEQLVIEYGGTPLKRVGDAIVAVFGAPIAIEDHAVLACHAALAMQRLKHGYPYGTATEPIAIRVGVHTGEALVRLQQLDINGPMVNLCSRLQELARPGNICISKVTYSAVQHIFECVPLGLKSLDGIDEPLEVYTLVRPHGFERSHFGLEHWNIDVPFVGRARERTILAQKIDQLARGRGCILGVWGDAGIGKSRLIAEARANANNSVLWLEGAAVSFGRSISYLPLLQIIRRYIGVRENDDEAVLRSQLSASVRDLFREETDDLLPYLATFLGLKVENDLKNRVAYLDGDAMGRQIRRSLRLFFERVARRRPTVLVFENFNWADQSSAELVEHLLPLVEKERLMICIVGRGEADSPDSQLRKHAAEGYPSLYVGIPLVPLQTEESKQIFDRLFLTNPELVQLRENILANAEGNPLFIVEVIHDLLESETLVHDSRQRKWSLNSNVHTFTIPETIHGVITERVDRLPYDVKQILNTASVIGRTFLYKVLRAITESDPADTKRLDGDLTDLLRREFIDEKQPDPELEYMFRHAVIQEVIYKVIVKERRRQIHRQVAEILERLFADRLNEFSAILAFHFGCADNWEKAQHYLFKAGDQADRLAANTEALYHYQQAVDACTRAFGERMDARQRSTVERKLGEAYYRRGQHALAFNHFEKSLDCLGHGRAHRALSTRRALLRELFVQLGHTIKPFRHSGVAPGSETEQWIAIYQMMAWMVLFDDPKRFLLYVLTILNEAERHSHSLGIALASAWLTFGCTTIGLTPLARYYHRKAVHASERSANPIAVSMARLAYAWHLNYRGAWDEAISCYADAAKVGWEAGDMRSWGSALYGQTLILCRRGSFAEAQTLTEKVLKTAEDSGDRVNIRSGTMSQGMILLRLNLLTDSEDILRSGLTMAEDAPDFLLSPQMAAELGLCLIRQERFKEADRVLDTAEGNIRIRGVRGHGAAILTMAITESRVAKAERALGSNRALYVKLAQRACKTALAQASIYRGVRPQALRLSGSCLWLAGREKDAHRRWLKALEAGEALGARYEQAQTYLARGRLTRNAADLQQGNSILSALISSVSVEHLETGWRTVDLGEKQRRALSDHASDGRQD
jgi:class 3 adenylate cyclase/tetratricopeptide (TPR) repeat protein